MAEPLRKQTINPGQNRRAREADFSYLNESAANDPNASIDERFAETAYQDNVLGPAGLGRREAANTPSYVEEADDVARSASPRPQTSRAMQNMLRQRLAKKAVGVLATTSGRVRASAINAEAFSWQVPLWLFVQVPFALLSIVTLVVVGTMDTIEKEANNGGVVAWVVNLGLKAAKALINLVGADFMAMAMNIYLLCTVIILGLGIFSISFLFLQYKIGFLEPLSGEGSGLKHGLLLLAFIGYSVPIANLFPFILLWMAAVWYYPR